MVPVAAETVQKKRRRFNDGDDEEAEFKLTYSTTSCIQLRGQRILVNHNRGDRNQCLSPNSDHDHEVLCSSSSIGSCEKRNIELPDLEDESIEDETSTHFSGRERIETTPSSEVRADPEGMDSRSRPSERRSTVVKMPTEAELEEFFSAAEEKLLNHFAEKYAHITICYNNFPSTTFSWQPNGNFKLRNGNHFWGWLFLGTTCLKSNQTLFHYVGNIAIRGSNEKCAGN